MGTSYPVAQGLVQPPAWAAEGVVRLTGFNRAPRGGRLGSGRADPGAGSHSGGQARRPHHTPVPGSQAGGPQQPLWAPLSLLAQPPFLTPWGGPCSPRQRAAPPPGSCSRAPRGAPGRAGHPHLCAPGVRDRPPQACTRPGSPRRRVCTSSGRPRAHTRGAHTCAGGRGPGRGHTQPLHHRAGPGAGLCNPRVYFTAFAAARGFQNTSGLFTGPASPSCLRSGSASRAANVPVCTPGQPTPGPQLPRLLKGPAGLTPGAGQCGLGRGPAGQSLPTPRATGHRGGWGKQAEQPCGGSQVRCRAAWWPGQKGKQD